MVLILNEIVTIQMPIISRRRFGGNESVTGITKEIVTIRNRVLCKEHFKEQYTVSGRIDGSKKLSKSIFYEVERKKYQD